MIRGVDKMDSSVIGGVIEGEVIPTEAPNTKKNIHKKVGDVTYSNKTIIKRLREHMVKGMKSKHSMTKPRFTAIQRRIDQGDLELKEQVDDVIAEHYAAYEDLLTEGLRGNIDVDSKLFRIATLNKRPYLSPEQAMIADGIAPTVAPVAPQLHFHQIGTQADYEKLEHRDTDKDEI